MNQRPQNWVFLGDSLTEGIGSARMSYVSELTSRLREAETAKPEPERRAVHEFRLRQVNAEGFNPFVKFNTAGLLKTDGPSVQPALWLWNLACEGRTIESDLEWLPLLENLRPERIFIFRGSLENIVRPCGLRDNQLPWWVPKSWRGYAAMDPRCYYSSTWWRRLKQQVIDALKQRVRLDLLRQRPGATLMTEEEWLEHYRNLLGCLRPLATRIHLLSLLPIDDNKFPGSLAKFCHVNEVLSTLAGPSGAQLIDWHSDFAEAMLQGQLSYLDGFHPNESGVEVMANLLLKHLSEDDTQKI
jgi:lysophospholipase L1-like esterase